MSAVLYYGDRKQNKKT